MPQTKGIPNAAIEVCGIRNHLWEGQDPRDGSYSPRYRPPMFSFLLTHASRPFREQVALLLTLSMLLALMAGALVPFRSEAASLSFISAMVTDSAPGVDTNYLVEWNSDAAVAAGQTIKIQFDPENDAFNLASLVDGDINVTNMTLVGVCSGGPGDEVTVAIDNSAPDENVTFTVCAGHTVPLGTTTVEFLDEHIGNPAAQGSHQIYIGGTQPNSGATEVAIVEPLNISAVVDTSLTFTITGVATSTLVNGETTTGSTSPSIIEFGRLVANTPKVMAQALAVSTNAMHGFTVTVRQDQNLTSSSGADIDLFQNGNANITPTTWSVPSAVITNENTFGHYGVTSEDADLNGDEFGSSLFAGNFATTSRTIFSHTGPSDGATPNIGATRVAYKIEVSALQEAATDYQNRLTYICTPLF